jgi:hypothetical protein
MGLAFLTGGVKICGLRSGSSATGGFIMVCCAYAVAVAPRTGGGDGGTSRLVGEKPGGLPCSVMAGFPAPPPRVAVNDVDGLPCGCRGLGSSGTGGGGECDPAMGRRPVADGVYVTVRPHWPLGDEPGAPLYECWLLYGVLKGWEPWAFGDRGAWPLLRYAWEVFEGLLGTSFGAAIEPLAGLEASVGLPGPK